jgi:hypothetical protein
MNGVEAGKVSMDLATKPGIPDLPLTALIGYGQGGADMIRVSSSLSIPAVLKGGDGHDVLVGGSGADYMYGDAGRDLMIGRAGKDYLRGNGQDDILIGGSTAYDNNTAALDAIMAEWTRTDSGFSTRVGRLKSGVSDGLNTTYNLIADGSSRTVFDDNVQDTLYGDADYDWLLANTDADGGSANDLIFTAESVTDID